MHGLAVYVKEGIPFRQDLSLENSADSYLCIRVALLHSVSYFFFLITQMRYSQSTHLLMFLSSETLSFIIRTDLAILMELINLVNSVIIFLSQMTLLRWLTFLLGSQTVTASICSTMAFPPLGNSDHVVVSVSIDFPLNSQ